MNDRDADHVADRDEIVDRAIDRDAIVGDTTEHGVWIERWRSLRDADASTNLCGLFADGLPPIDVRIDLACMDLIHRRRRGDDVIVEDYLVPSWLDALSSQQRSDGELDLIDAEICVRHELGDVVPVTRWIERFAKHAESIQSLLLLDGAGNDGKPTALPNDSLAFSSDGFVNDLSSQSLIPSVQVTGELSLAEFSIDPPTLRSAGGADWADGDVGRDPNAGGGDASQNFDAGEFDGPDWFVPGRMVAQGPGYWVLRGSHRVDHRGLTLKVLELGEDASNDAFQTAHRLLGRAGEVKHPVWTPPDSSAVREGHLAVLRVWVDGVPWESIREPADRLARRLADVGYAVAAGFEVGASHGGLTAANLWIDHRGLTRITDAAASRRGWSRWLYGGKLADQTQRQQNDVNDYADLIAQSLRGAAVQHDAACSIRQLIDACNCVVDSRPPTEATPIIADALNAFADGAVPRLPTGFRSGGSSWLRRWFSRTFASMDFAHQSSDSTRPHR